LQYLLRLALQVIDATTYAAWGVDYLKEDSCNAAQDHPTAFHEYAAMRDALNGTGRSFLFSLCGWESWYAPVGEALGNSWRMGPDDTNWAGVLQDIDDEAPLWPYAGPGGWNVGSPVANPD
jgi:alpha-galactosidase